jgi:hypothetical protein
MRLYEITRPPADVPVASRGRTDNQRAVRTKNQRSRIANPKQPVGTEQTGRTTRQGRDTRQRVMNNRPT